MCHPIRFGQGEHYFIVKMGCCWQRFGSSTDRFQASSGKHNHKKQQLAKLESESQNYKIIVCKKNWCSRLVSSCCSSSRSPCSCLSTSTCTSSPSCLLSRFILKPLGGHHPDYWVLRADRQKDRKKEREKERRNDKMTEREIKGMTKRQNDRKSASCGLIVKDE